MKAKTKKSKRRRGPNELLVERWRRGDQVAMAELMKRNVGLLYRTVSRFHHPSLTIEDLMQEGRIGIMEAMRHFDDRKAAFTTYAVLWIAARARRAVMRGLKNPKQRRIASRLGRTAQDLRQRGLEPTTVNIAESLGVQDDEVRQVCYHLARPVSIEAVSDEQSRPGCYYEIEGKLSVDPTTEQDIDRAHQAAALRAAVRRLPERLRRIVEQRWLVPEHRLKTLQDIGDSWDLSRERIRQLEHQAFRMLREQLREEAA